MLAGLLGITCTKSALSVQTGENVYSIKFSKAGIQNCLDTSDYNHKQLKVNTQKLTKLFGVVEK